MNIKNIILSSVLLVSAISFFYSCDKIDEPYFKEVYTDRSVLTEMISDAQQFDANSYADFVTLTSNNPLVIPMIVLSGDNSVSGNSEAATSIINEFSLSTSDDLCMINRRTNSSGFGIAKSNWESQLNSELKQKGEFNLTLEGEIDFADTTFKADYTVTSLNGYSEPIQTSVYVLEDSVNVNGTIVSNLLRESNENISDIANLKRNENASNSLAIDLSRFSVSQIYKLKVLIILKDAVSKEVLQVTHQEIGSINFDKQQKALIEDFTGQHCTFCPKAHEEITRLEGVFGDKVVAMAIHYGWQADTDADYPVDYKTTVGTAIGDHFADQSDPLPFGFVNRVKHGNNWKLDFGQWDAEVNRITSLTAKAGIAIEANITNNTLEANVYVKAFEQLDTLVKIQGFIIESHMHSKQKFYEAPWEIDDYEQNHVLRASVNGNWGEDLTPAPFAADQIIKKQFSYTLSSDWVPENLALIVIVYNSISEEIIQVEEKEL